jgi:putative tricarboxylic transport membrane protein
MRWLKPIVSFFLVCFSLLVLTVSQQLGIGNVQSPGPGFMGFLASVLLLALSFIILVRESIKAVKENREGTSNNWGGLAKSLILIAALCCYTLILELLGYLIATFFLMFVMLYVFNPKKFYWQLVVSFVITTSSYLVFHTFLQVVLPAGIFRIGW